MQRTLGITMAPGKLFFAILHSKYETSLGSFYSFFENGKYMWIDSGEENWYLQASFEKFRKYFKTSQNFQNFIRIMPKFSGDGERATLIKKIFS